MSKTSPGFRNQDQLEKGLIGLVLGSIIILQFFFKEDESLSTIFLVIHGLAFIGLIAFYIQTSPRNYWTAIMTGLVFYSLTKFSFINAHYYKILNIALAVVFAIAGAFIVFHAIKKSQEYKAFESIGFLLGVFLLFLPLLSVFLGSAFEGFPLLYNFGLAFLISTILYNDNLWDQYIRTQQKFIILTLLIALTNIIVIASKQF